MSSSIGPVSQTRATPTPSSTTPNLEGLCRGSRGPDVVALQQALNARGAKLETDGKFGPLTEAALKKFQADSGCGGAGRVDAGTVTALQQPPPAPSMQPAPTATPAPTPSRASAMTQAGARARCAADEGRVRAQLAAVPAKPAATTTPATTPATTTPPVGEALSPQQVSTALSNIEAGKKQIADEKAALGQVQEALQREVSELEKPVAGATRSVADEAVLAGRRGQLEAVTKAQEVLDLKTQGYDAVATAVKDGVLTSSEVGNLATVDHAVRQGEAAVTTHFRASSSLVDKGLRAGGRGSPALGLKKPDPTTTPTSPASPAGTAIAPADVERAKLALSEAKTNVRAEQQALATTKATLGAEVKTLEALKDRTPADDAVLAGRRAQLQVLDKAAEHLEIRLAGLDAASRAVGDGVLTDEEQKNLATIDTSLSTAQQALAAQASLAVELIRAGRAAGGRGSDVHL